MKSRTWNSWRDMKQRCINPNNASYRNYGEVGVTYTPRWESFTEFYADMGECPTGFTLDRIDNNGHYQPKNCRWVSIKDNRRNSSRTKLDIRKVQLIKGLLRAKRPGVSTGKACMLIAPLFLVDWKTIRSIANKVSWTDVK